MTERNFNTAGWMAIVSAVLNAPVLVVTVAAVFLPENPALRVLGTVLSVATALLAIYLLVALRQLLHRHDFHAADFWFALLIGGYLVAMVLQIVAEAVPGAESVTGVLLLFVLFLGVISAVFGFKILPAARVVAGPVRPFVYFTIATGVCLATLILLPIGLITTIVADVLLAMIFFRASAAPIRPEIAE